VEPFIISVVESNISVFGEMCGAHLIPNGPHRVCYAEHGYLLLSELGRDLPRPEVGWTYKIYAVTSPEAHWEKCAIPGARQYRLV
jgi:hypothetical protein